MKKTILIASVLLFCRSSGTSQSLSSTVIGNAGTYLDEAIFGTLHYTVGELAVAHFNGPIELGEGFHHRETDLIVFTREATLDRSTFHVYPNPTRQYLMVESEHPLPFQLTLYDAAGRMAIPWQPTQLQTRLQMDHLAAGQYWLRLRTEDGTEISYLVIKVEE